MQQTEIHNNTKVLIFKNHTLVSSRFEVYIRQETPLRLLPLILLVPHWNSLSYFILFPYIADIQLVVSRQYYMTGRIRQIMCTLNYFNVF